MANPKHKGKPLVNAKEKEHSTLTIVDVGFNMTGLTVSGNQLTGDHGVWAANREGDQAHELRLLLTCHIEPTRGGKRPTSGELTITLTDATNNTTPVPLVPVDYVNDTPPP